MGVSLMGKLRVFEAFSGIGSQRMALRNLGIDHEVVGISEIDKWALLSYEAIHGDCPNFGDVSKIEPRDLPDMDLFTYSFPCQDLSVAGKTAGLGEGTRSGLLYECEKIIEAKRPKYLLLENVKNLVGKQFKGDFDKWLEYLESLGYTNYWKVMNAKDYGIPQNRERVFVVSILNGENDLFSFEQPYHIDQPFRSIQDFNFSEKLIVNKPYTIVNKGKIIAEFNDINFEQSKRIHSLDNYFQCLNARDRGTDHVLLDDGIVRRITLLERWRLMGFSDEDFYKAKQVSRDTELAKQAGNSIVVPVLESIFRSLFKEEDEC